MKSTGIRVTPSTIYYAIIDIDEKTIALENMLDPKVLPIPGQLRFIRTNIQSIIMEHRVSGVGLRKAEPISTNQNIIRLNIEGVIQELISNTFVKTYFSGCLKQMAAKLGTNVSKLKENINKKNNQFINLNDNIKISSAEQYEAACVALVATKCQEDFI